MWILPMFDGQVCPVGERKCGHYLCLMGKCVLWVSECVRKVVLDGCVCVCVGYVTFDG
jgi:hypothetical protein